MTQCQLSRHRLEPASSWTTMSAAVGKKRGKATEKLAQSKRYAEARGSVRRRACGACGHTVDGAVPLARELREAAPFLGTRCDWPPGEARTRGGASVVARLRRRPYLCIQLHRSPPLMQRLVLPLSSWPPQHALGGGALPGLKRGVEHGVLVRLSHRTGH